MKTIVKPTISFFLALAILLPFLFIFGCDSNPSSKRNNKGDEDNQMKVRVQGSGMDSLALAQIPLRMQQFVDERKIAGSVTLVARNGQIASFEAVGFQDIDKEIPMSKNTIFRIASLSKPFAAASIMILSDEGKLNIHDPVEKYLPEFRDMWLASEVDSKKAVLIRPNRKITILDILTHTSGLSGLPKEISVKSIAEYVMVVSQRPLQFEPGTLWRYGGSGITTAARIVEVISGKPYEEFLAERIFTPLGMKSTYFSVPQKEQNRVATLYLKSEDQGLAPTEVPEIYEFPLPRPEGGLFSTASDMSRWMQAMLNGGILNGTRILSETSVKQMTQIQTGELLTGFTEGMSFGLAFGIVRHPTGVTSMLSPGTFGHGGAFGTQSWADPVTKTIYILMIQRQGFGNGDDSDIRKEFQRSAAGAII